jgi:hypothetical protein
MTRRTRRNIFSIKRIPGEGEATVTATISLKFKGDDKQAVERFAHALRELIPENERAEFLEDFRRAASSAGFQGATTRRPHATS